MKPSPHGMTHIPRTPGLSSGVPSCPVRTLAPGGGAVETYGGETSPLDPETFAKLCNRARLGHWHPHELRHSGASLMLAQGTPLHVVSEILGHASIMITKDITGHLLEGDRGGRGRGRAYVRYRVDALLDPPARG